MNRKENQIERKNIYIPIISFLLFIIIISAVHMVVGNPAIRLACVVFTFSLCFTLALILPYFQKDDLKCLFQNKKYTFFLIFYFILMILMEVYAVRHLSGKMLKIIASFLVISLLVTGFLVSAGISRKRIGSTRTYVILAAVLGISFDFIMPVGMVPDEWSHLDTAYMLSNEMMGINEKKNPDDVIMRKDDSEFEIMQTDVSAKDYENYLTSSGDSLKNENLVSTESRSLNGNEYLYIFPACGITIGRLFHMNSFWVMNLGRFCNFVFCILITSIAVQLIPVGKWILILSSLMPTALQQNMSYSYDVPVNAFAFLIIAISVRLLTDEKYKPKILIIVLSLTGIFVLLMAKSHAYFLLALLPVFVLIRRSLKINQDEKNRVMKRILIVMLILIALVFAFFMSGAALKVIPESHRFVSWGDKKEGYTFWYFAKNPMQLIILPFNTIKWQMSTYFTSYFGKWMGWFEINTGNLPSLIFSVLMLLAILSEDTMIVKKDGRILFWLAGVGTILCVFAGFLFSYSTLSKPYIEGVQGRYLIPAVTLILVTISGSIRKKKSINPLLYVYGCCFTSVWTINQILLWYVSVH